MTAPRPDRADAVLLDALLGPLAESLRQVGLPLHILLESRFGELNENQVEMIAAARQAADEADVILRRAERVRALERQPRVVRDGTTRPLDLCRGALAIASAREAHRGVRFDADLSPALPRVRGDRAHLEEGLTLVLCDAGALSAKGATVRVRAEDSDPAAVRLVIEHGTASPALTLERILAARLIEAEGGVVEQEAGTTIVRLPR